MGSEVGTCKYAWSLSCLHDFDPTFKGVDIRFVPGWYYFVV